MIYQETASDDGVIGNSILCIENGKIIPKDPANTDYQQYLKWLEDGNTPLPADPVE
jgi:hypothetical protein